MFQAASHICASSRDQILEPRGQHLVETLFQYKQTRQPTNAVLHEANYRILHNKVIVSHARK